MISESEDWGPVFYVESSLNSSFAEKKTEARQREGMLARAALALRHTSPSPVPTRDLSVAFHSRFSFKQCFQFQFSWSFSAAACELCEHRMVKGGGDLRDHPVTSVAH